MVRNIDSTPQLKKFSGATIHVGMRPAGPLSESAIMPVMRILAAEGSGDGVAHADRTRLWESLRTARRLKVVFDSYLNYERREAHLGSLRQIEAGAEKLVRQLHSQPEALRPGTGIGHGDQIFADSMIALEVLHRPFPALA